MAACLCNNFLTLVANKNTVLFNVTKRCLAVVAGSSGPNAPRHDAAKQNAQPAAETDYQSKDSWLRWLIPTRRIETHHQSQSQLLADKNTVFELQIHAVKPENMEEYLKGYGSFVNKVHEKGEGARIAGSWTTEIGEQDEAVHLWRYEGGYPVLNRFKEIHRSDKEFIALRIERNRLLRSRKNMILLPFTFWGDIQPRSGKNIYELRSYILQPGTMIEWGNNWAKGIKYRQEKNEAVAGYFTHIGDLYAVQHFWAYESLQDRKQVRESAWQRPGWDECVSHTVPLIRHMNTRILIPTPFSPMQ